MTNQKIVLNSHLLKGKPLVAHLINFKGRIVSTPPYNIIQRNDVTLLLLYSNDSMHTVIGQLVGSIFLYSPPTVLWQHFPHNDNFFTHNDK